MSQLDFKLRHMFSSKGPSFYSGTCLQGFVWWEGIEKKSSVSPAASGITSPEWSPNLRVFQASDTPSVIVRRILLNAFAAAAVP